MKKQFSIWITPGASDALRELAAEMRVHSKNGVPSLSALCQWLGDTYTAEPQNTVVLLNAAGWLAAGGSVDELNLNLVDSVAADETGEPAEPPAPGEVLLKQFMKPAGITTTQLAAETGLPKWKLDRLISEHVQITPGIALRLADYFETTPEFWLNLQLERLAWLKEMKK